MYKIMVVREDFEEMGIKSFPKEIPLKPIFSEKKENAIKVFDELTKLINNIFDENFLTMTEMLKESPMESIEEIDELCYGITCEKISRWE